MRRYYLPAVIAALILAFWLKPEVQEIAAGIAIFLFGMLMLEDGFKLFGGGLLERALDRATASTPRALMVGLVSTTALQSSTLVSVLTISFLSAGLISLTGGIGVIFGANIGTTTGAWLVAGFGLKVNVSAYAMPMLALSIILVFQKQKTLRGIGYALAGLGFLFLGIHHIKEGFATISDQIDLTRYALAGIAGLVAYTLLGTLATAIMQSSHASMVLVITALAAGQITYDNALALAIGANIGTTVTAILGALPANYQGRRLALAHLIFNAATALVALAFIAPLRETVDWLSAGLGIGAADLALKLALFHTVFNLLGVVLMVPALRRLVRFLEAQIPEPVPDVSRPRYLSGSVDAFPQILESALRKEVLHLYENAAELMLHGLNLDRAEIHAADSLGDLVATRRAATDLDFEAEYERRVKTLYSAIVDYASRVGGRGAPPEIGARIDALRDISGNLVQAVKSVKHLRKNVLRYTTRHQGTVTGLYDRLRAEIARIIVEIDRLEETDPAARSALWLDQERAQIEEDARSTTRRIDMLIRTGALQPAAATSFLNDSGYAYDAMRQLIAAARAYYVERDSAMAEVEKILALDEDDLAAPEGPPKLEAVPDPTPARQAGGARRGKAARRE